MKTLDWLLPGKRGLRRELEKCRSRVATLLKQRDDARKKRDRFKEELKSFRIAWNRLDDLACYRYGALNEGINAWERRWESSETRNVLFLTMKDASGSFMKWAEALNTGSSYAVRQACYRTHGYGYPIDMILPHPSVEGAIEEIKRLCSEADIIHLKWEDLPWDKSFGAVLEIVKNSGKPLVFTHYGGYARSRLEDPEYIESVSQFDARIAMTPDLNPEWFQGEFIPHAVDSERLGVTWRDSGKVAHSPSTAKRKGTEEFLAALKRLDLDVEYEQIQGVSHRECLLRKMNCSLFFDQAGREDPNALGVNTIIGWYGNSALEAMVHGIPTIAHLSDVAFQGAERAGKDIRKKCPILNTAPTTEGMEQVLRHYFNMSRQERADLSARTRQWVEDFHSYPQTARELSDLYDQLL
jgi:hypothetical protein